MQVIARRTLKKFWEKHPLTEKPLKAWFKIVSGARWRTPQDAKDMFGNASFVGDNRIVFNICGNEYRLVVHVAYDPYFRVLIKFVGTHAEYDAIDVETV